MIRNDGSIYSANYPGWDRKFITRDYGIYKALVRAVYYTDDEFNDADGKELVYKVIVIGGDRDGQIFTSARTMRTLGGAFNYETTVLKAAEGLTGADPASLVGQLDPSIGYLPTQNGDIVYIQFINGDPMMPLIVGCGHHQKSPDEATSDDGQISDRTFNGLNTNIDADGVVTITKDNGAAMLVGANLDDSLYPYVNQFAPFPGQTEAFATTLDNDYTLSIAFTPGPCIDLAGGLTADEIGLSTELGTAITITGLESDVIEMATATGALITIDGLSDTIELNTSAGAAISIDGLEDSIDLSTTAGNAVSLGASGISIASLDQSELTMEDGAVSLQNATGATLELGAEGFIKLGNSSGDVLKDILQELIKSLSTASYSGFGAPGSNVADLIQLLTKIQLITGG